MYLFIYLFIQLMIIFIFQVPEQLSTPKLGS